MYTVLVGSHRTQYRSLAAARKAAKRLVRYYEKFGAVYNAEGDKVAGYAFSKFSAGARTSQGLVRAGRGKAVRVNPLPSHWTPGKVRVNARGEVQVMLTGKAAKQAVERRRK